MVTAEDMLLLYVRLRQKTVGTRQALDEVDQALWNVRRKVGHAPAHKESFMMSNYLTPDPVAEKPRRSG
jgi:hypothetical protein